MSELRERVLDATFAEVADAGLAALTVEAVAIRAGSSRATVYRHFPGGRDELVAETIRREVERFLAAVVADAGDRSDPIAHVTAMMVAAERVLVEHTVLQHLLLDEADQILPSLAVVRPLVHDRIRSHLRDVLATVRSRDGLVEGVAVDAAADHCTRMLLSYVESPDGADLADAAAAERVVRSRILAGVVKDVTEPGH